MPHQGGWFNGSDKIPIVSASTVESVIATLPESINWGIEHRLSIGLYIMPSTTSASGTELPSIRFKGQLRARSGSSEFMLTLGRLKQLELLPENRLRFAGINIVCSGQKCW